MAKKIKERPLTPNQLKLKSSIGERISDIKEDILYSMERQYTNYGKNKSHSWNDVSWNVKDARDNLNIRNIDEAIIFSNRIFDQSGCSIEVSAYLSRNSQTDNVTPGNMLLAFSDSIERDADNKFIKHGEDTKIAYVNILASGIDVIIPDTAEGKTQSIEEFKANRMQGKSIRIFDRERSVKNGQDIDISECLQQVSEELGNIDPKFAELLEVVLSNRDKQFVDAQPDNTTVLNDILSKKVTAQDVKKTTGFFGKLFGKDKEKSSQGR